MKKYKLREESHIHVMHQGFRASMCGISRETLNRILNKKTTTTFAIAFLLILLDDREFGRRYPIYLKKFSEIFEFVD